MNTIKLKINPNKLFFTADPHFAHENILKHFPGKFEDLTERENAIINNWNQKVTPNDTVIVLGDFAFKSAEAYRNKLNGSLWFIRGNHDESTDAMFATKRAASCDRIDDVAFIEVGKQRIWLSHYPHYVWPSSGYGSWHLCGHSHGTLHASLPTTLTEGKILDVGVDIHNYTPLSFEEVKTIMDKKSVVEMDRHKKH